MNPMEQRAKLTSPLFWRKNKSDNKKLNAAIDL